MIAGLLLAQALQGGTAAAPAAPASVTEPTIMVVEFTRGATMIGFPRRCPGSTSDDPADTALCLAELYQGRVRVVRYISGPHFGRHTLVRLTAHARRWRPGTRILVAAYPFEDSGTTGQFAAWWHLPEDEGDYCLDVESLARDGDNPVTRAFAYGSRRNFIASGWVDRASFRCLDG